MTAPLIASEPADYEPTMKPILPLSGCSCCKHCWAWSHKRNVSRPPIKRSGHWASHWHSQPEDIRSATPLADLRPAGEEEPVPGPELPRCASPTRRRNTEKGSTTGLEEERAGAGECPDKGLDSGQRWGHKVRPTRVTRPGGQRAHPRPQRALRLILKKEGAHSL